MYGMFVCGILIALMGALGYVAFEPYVRALEWIRCHMPPYGKFVDSTIGERSMTEVAKRPVVLPLFLLVSGGLLMVFGFSHPRW